MVLVVVAIVVSFRVRQHQEQLLTLEDTAASVATLEHTRAQLFLELAALSGLMVSDDPAFLDLYHEAAAGMEQDLSKARAEAVATGKADHVAALDDLTERIGNLNQTTNATAPVLARADPEARVQLTNAAMPEMWAEVGAVVVALDQLAVEEQAELAAERATASDAAAVTSWIVVGFGGVALLVATGMVVATIASVIGPLVSLRATAKAITSGDLESRARVSGPEEVASVARAFNEMTDALAAKTKEYVDTTNLTGDMIVRLDKDGRFTFLNDAACETFGKPRKELLGTDATTFLRPEDLEAATQAVEEVMESKGLAKGLVSRFVTPMGTRLVEWNGYPLFDEEGQYAGIQITGRDISERKQMEEALSAKTEEYVAVTNLTGEIIAKVDEGGRWTFLNDAACQFYGRSREELLGADSRDCIHPEDLEPTVQAVRKAAATGEAIEGFVNRQVTPMGTRVVEWNASPFFDEEGRYAGIQMTGRDITERKKAEEGLRESEEKYRRLVQDSTDGIAIVQGTETQFANRALLKMYGTDSEEDMVGRPFTDFVSPEHRELMVERASARQAGERIPAQYEFKALRKDGTDFDAEISVSRITYQGRPAVQGIVRDITERKRMEEALRESEARYRLLAENASDVIWTLDMSLKYTYVSPSFTRMRGYTLEEMMKSTVRDTLTPASLEVATKVLAEEMAIERMEQKDLLRSRTLEIEVICKDGSTVWTEVRVTFLRDEDGRPLGILGVSRDITERRQAEQALRKSEEEFRLVFENAKDAIFWADPETGVIIKCNRSAESLLEKEAEQIIGQPQTVLHPLEKAEYYAEMFKRHIEQEGSADDQAEVIAKSGRVIPVHITASVVSVGGRPIVQGIFHDISERNKAEQALRESEELFRSLSTSAPIGIFVTDVQGKCTYTNPRLLEIAGLTLEESLGHGWIKVIHPEDRRAILEQANQAAGQGRDLSYDVRIVTGEGQLHWVHIHTTPTFSAEGEVIGRVGAVEDITERRQMEDALAAKTKEYIDTTNLTGDIIAKLDKHGNWVFLNDAACRFYGKPREELLGTDSRAFVHPEDLEATAEAIRETRTRKELVAGFVNRQLTPMGTRVVEWDGYPIFDDEGHYAGIQITGHDITQRKQMEEALRESEARYRLLAENTSDLIWTMDMGLRYTYMSPSVTRMRGYSVEEVVGSTVTETMTPASVEVARKALAEELAMERMADKDPHRSRKVEFEMYCKDGSTIWTEMNMTFLRDPEGKPIGILGVTRDISERKKAEEERERLNAELEMRAITDSLTGLYDHAHFYQRLAEEIERSKRYKHGFALLLMDVDDFKRFNESRGHKVGDEMLRLVAHCIPAGLRHSDLAFRYGGDEFAAILPHADTAKARIAVDRINRRITTRLKQMDGGPGTRLTLTAGVACFPDDGTTADELVRIADATLYNAKWVARARDIMGQKEDIQSLVSALVSRQGGVEDPADGAVFRPEALHEQQARIVSSVASSIAVALKDAGVAQALEDPDLQVLATVGAAAEIKDRYIRGHPERMSEWAVALAEEMGLSPERVRDICIAALLHDIGKVTVSEGILNKPGKLTRREFASIKDHPIVGATLVSQVKGFERVVPIVRHHHERFDGTGYPDGLAGEDIPPESRILSVLDVFDALTHERSYRKAQDREEALAVIERGAGTQFDPVVVKAFLALVKRGGDGLRAPARAASEDRQLAVATKTAGRRKG
jgi:diguanylate cyclase (GGDEF)-like protein/PAS domain S-box-containing protein/putative nucleotidyltransferase with HDIG domain